MEIYIVRHGETDWNKEKRIQGRANLPMNDTGRNQVEKLATALSYLKFDVVYSSPLNRAIETAQIISGQKELIIDERLYEINFGDLEGFIYKDIQRMTDMVMEEKFLRTRNFFLYPEQYVPSEDGESYQELFERIGSFFEDLKEKYQDKNVLIVSHSTCIHAMLSYFKNIPLSEFWKIHLGNCSVSKVIYKNNEYKVIEEGRTY